QEPLGLVGVDISVAVGEDERRAVDDDQLVVHADGPPTGDGRYARAVHVVDQIAQGLWNAFQMAWEVWWALVLGFLLSGIVQAWVPRARMERALGGRGLRSLALATGFGAASSSCSYAAVAIAKSAFQKGASLAAA